MRTSTILPLSALVAVASSLVIPNIDSQNIFSVLLKDDNFVAQTSPFDIDHPVLNKELLPKSEAAALISSNPQKVIPHSYIVVFKDGTSVEEADFHTQWINAKHLEASKAFYARHPDHRFFKSLEAQGVSNLLGGVANTFNIEGLFSGYTGHFSPIILDLIRRHPLVKFVEEDSRVQASEFDTQNGAPWGLARISHRNALSLGSFNKYLYDDEGGEGVTSYVIDTGVHVKHNDFEGRANWGKTIPVGDDDIDGNGHGTHCAGTIASKHYGVAKKANIVAVKVLRSNGSGSMSDVLKGVEYAANAHIKATKENAKGFKGSTANMSLGGGKSPSLDMAVNAAVEAGIHFAVAAGNDNADACNYSPAAAEKAVTVGASTLSDSRAYFSNYGKCVDIFGPGLNVLSTYIGSDTATATLSGTSMASPHVAGLLTYYLSLQPSSDSGFSTGKGGITPLQLKKKIIQYSTKNALSDISADTPNFLIYNGGGQDLSKFWDSSSESTREVEIEEAIHRLGEKTQHLYNELKDIIGTML